MNAAITACGYSGNTPTNISHLFGNQLLDNGSNLHGRTRSCLATGELTAIQCETALWFHLNVMRCEEIEISAVAVPLRERLRS